MADSSKTAPIFSADAHVFSVGGRHFVFDVKSITSLEVDEPVARAVELVTSGTTDDVEATLAASFGTEVAQRSMEVARTLSGAGVLATSTDRRPAPSATVPKRPITNVHLMLTSSCTMNCAYCYGQTEFDLHDRTKRMPEETVRNAIDFLVRESLDAPEISITFFGGEPLLELPKIELAVEYANRAAQSASKTIRFDLTTNGSLLTDNAIDMLAELGVNVLLSWDGPEDIQRRNRPFYAGQNEPQHDRTLKRIRNFIKGRHGNVGVRATVIPEDADRVPDVINYFKELGVARVALTMAEDTFEFGTRGVEGPDTNATPGGEPAEQAERYKAAAYLIYLLAGVGLQDMKLARMLQQVYNGQTSNYGCGAGRGMLTVESNGDVLPCYRFIGKNLQSNPLVVGNVTGEFDRERLRPMHELQVDQLADCHDCWARYVCGGGCAAESHAARSGAVEDRYHSRACMSYRRQLELAIWILAELQEHAPEVLERIGGQVAGCAET